MKLQLVKLNAVALATFAFLVLATQNASALSIQVTQENDNTLIDNVLFNDPTLPHSGLLVQGNFNGSGTGYVVNFKSSSGNGQLLGNGGQASIEGLAGNNPLTSVTFGLTNNATFTKAVLNPDATVNGTIKFTVNYVLGDGGTIYTETTTLGGNGSNYYTIRTIGVPDARITSVTFSSTDSAFNSISQFRMAGFAPELPPSVPDGGSTVALLGLGLVGLAGLRNKFGMRASA